MAVKLDITKRQLIEGVKLHFLPAEIETNVQAKVDEYFNNYTREDSHLINSLRGFPLIGMEFQVPSNLNGVVFQEVERSSGYCDRLLRVTGTFESMTYWNYDKVPSAADELRQALEALLVVEELFEPITADEIDQELNVKPSNILL